MNKRGDEGNSLSVQLVSCLPEDSRIKQVRITGNAVKTGLFLVFKKVSEG